jgi:hypothetical protein
MPQFDLFNQAVLTQLIEDDVESTFERQAFVGEQIAPTVQVPSRTVRLQFAKQYSLGVGQPKAPDAMFPLIEMPTGEYTERMYNLADLEEGHRITSDQWMQLNSSDDNYRRQGGLDIIERGRILQVRMERLTEKMRWQAFTTGTITLTYPTGGAYVVDYGLPAGHLPTAATLWSDHTNSDPIADLRAWQQKVADDAGAVATRIFLSTEAANHILANDKLRDYFYTDPLVPNRPFRPTLDQVAQLLAGGSLQPNTLRLGPDADAYGAAGATTFVIYDAGYRPMASGANLTDAHTRYLAANKVLLTTPLRLNGEPIADTSNGQVEISSGVNSTAIVQGPQSEILLDHLTKNHYLRQASSRIVRLYHPEAFLCATVAA